MEYDEADGFIPENAKRAPYGFGIGKRKAYSHTGTSESGSRDEEDPVEIIVLKRNAYRLKTGKREPYGFGIGKKNGKRAPYGFGIGKRQPYGFGIGKREPTDIRKLDSLYLI